MGVFVTGLCCIISTLFASILIGSLHSADNNREGDAENDRARGKLWWWCSFWRDA